MQVCVRACVRACMRACVRVRAHTRGAFARLPMLTDAHEAGHPPIRTAADDTDAVAQAGETRQQQKGAATTRLAVSCVFYYSKLCVLLQ